MQKYYNFATNMNYQLFAPTNIAYEVALPASKSISNRVLILNALSPAPAMLRNIAVCDDTEAMVEALGKENGNINIGAAGTAMRFLTAFFASQEGLSVTIDGSERMRHRPIKILVDALRSCGADISYAGEEGFPPLKITGKKLKAEKIEIAGNVSSQYISALLMIAPTMGGTSLHLTGNVISRPYIDMTIQLMRQFGVNAAVHGNIIDIPSSSYSATDFTIENDWSAASYWFSLQTLLPKSRITLRGLNKTSVQGDSAIVELFLQLGVTANWCGQYLDLRNNPCADDKIVMDLSGNPDLAQTIVVTLCLLDRKFLINGLQTLKIKETDRIEALRSQLLKLGYAIDVLPDYSLSWDGKKCEPQKNPSISTFADHRMAMAFAPAAILFPGIIIEDIDVVSKSYPNFWKHLSEAGFHFNETNAN
jgi:3-phosphoshikimate 1-carboxyvinyltransferase